MDGRDVPRLVSGGPDLDFMHISNHATSENQRTSIHNDMIDIDLCIPPESLAASPVLLASSGLLMEKKYHWLTSFHSPP
jgi:hypothetical protein